MDKDWLLSLDPKTIVVVPTNSLANHLAERYAATQLEQGKTVWQSPNILLWPEFIKRVWRSNQAAVSLPQLLSSAQSDLLWTKVIEQSARKDHALLLLNIPQTVRAVRASWQKLHDWCLDEQQLEAEFAADHHQLLLWFKEYRQALAKRNLIDPAQIQSMSIEQQANIDFSKLVWFSYDLITLAQRRINETLAHHGVDIEMARPQAQAVCIAKRVFDDERSEVAVVFRQARRYLEDKPTHKIAIVVPDLQHRYREIQDAARDVFYPELSPLDVSKTAVVYRFSLGQALIDLAPINTALSLIDLLRGAISITDIKLIFRSSYIGDLFVTPDAGAKSKQIFLAWLAGLRVHSLSLLKLKQLYEQSTAQSPELIEFMARALVLQEDTHKQLADAKQAHGFASLSFTQWLQNFDDWLSLWGWSTSVKPEQASSHEYQLQQRWQKASEEVIALSLVQKTAGFARIIELVKGVLRETIFLPKASSSPIIISGTLEAIGHEVDLMFVTGMHEDFPKPAALDAFIPKRILAEQGHPHASVEKDFDYQKEVIQNLLKCAANYQLSYARVSAVAADIERSASPLFDKDNWQAVVSEQKPQPAIEMESYRDLNGPVLSHPETVNGGAKIFENQSNCAFRAFASHRLGLRAELEVDFGLDALDRGNIVHYLLETLWLEIESQDNLSDYSELQLKTLVEGHIDRAIQANPLHLPEEKQTLLHYERKRLSSLLLEWMKLELLRPIPFKVVERELKGQAQLAGVSYRYIIDRVDELIDGRRVVVDYKTGSVDRKDWVGDRVKSPQLPLYAFAIDEPNSEQAVAGISFAKVKRWNCAYEELADDGIFRDSNRYTQARAELWQQESATWEQRFEALAQAFCAGEAQVNPIDASTCEYCELDALCRIGQLRGESSND